jgi:hypothetical protein
MCRIEVKNSDKAKVFANDEQSSDSSDYKFLLKDAKCNHNGGNPHEGYSVILFGT